LEKAYAFRKTIGTRDLRITITGVQGFIGSHLAAFSLERGHDVIGIARSPSSAGQARIERLNHKRNFHVRYVDLATEASGITERADIVFHLAAKTSVDQSILDPSTFLRNNYLASFNLLEDARRHRVSRFIQMSTDEVYGPIVAGSYEENGFLRPSNPYAATKGACDLLVQAYHTTYEFPGIIARASNVYGPWQNPQKAIPTFVRSALSDLPLPIFGDGSHRRAWIAVEDVCSALWAIAEKGDLGNIYHIASEDEKTNLGMAQAVLQVLQKSTELVNFIPDREARPGHDARYSLKNTKLLSLGWRPTLTLDANLSSVIRWFQNNAWWLTT
jgi:dTDP-glucose 4,6-dehydratase